MSLKAVLFDLGGTLVKTASPPEIIKRILDKHGVERTIKDIALAHRAAEMMIWQEDYRLPYYEFWIKWNTIILERLKVCENINFLARALVDEWWDNADVESYSDAEPTLMALTNMGLNVGIVTNAFEKDIKDIFARVKLPNVFNVYVGIDTVGKPKPNAEIFLYAVNALKIQPNEALFVGDSLENDYFGALRAGLKAILIDRNC
ncbi:HAD family hydrolase, partial [Candidatus Bathyarchaeota archaeon]|nr:HAD family hydrolase [Candidatus Bathyarchaeota archaeon]